MICWLTGSDIVSHNFLTTLSLSFLFIDNYKNLVYNWLQLNSFLYPATDFSLCKNSVFDSLLPSLQYLRKIIKLMIDFVLLCSL